MTKVCILYPHTGIKSIGQSKLGEIYVKFVFITRLLNLRFTKVQIKNKIEAL